MSKETDLLSKYYKELLQVGMVFNNYKELCMYLGQPIRDGKSKRLQEKEWNRYFRCEKEKRKYIIKEVYPEPLSKEDKRAFGNNSKYVHLIESVLMNYLSKMSNRQDSGTQLSWFKKLCLVNSNYQNDSYDYTIKNSYKNISEFDINNFYQRTYERLSKILFDSLRNLKKRGLISYSEVKMVCKLELIGGRMRRNIVPATKEEIKIIDGVEKEVLKDMGIESKRQVHLKFKEKQFFGKVKSILNERYNIESYFTEITISIRDNESIKLRNLNEIDEDRILLNRKILDAVNENAKRNYEKNLEEYEEYFNQLMEGIIGEPSGFEGRNFFTYKEDYLDNQMQLADLLIKV